MANTITMGIKKGYVDYAPVDETWVNGEPGARINRIRVKEDRRRI